MLSLTNLPSADLLQQFQGVEQGLRTNRKVNHGAWIGLLIAVAAAASVFITQGLSVEGTATWVLVVICLLAVGALLVLVRTRFWVKESRSPLRYTCSVEDFRALGNVAQDDFAELAVWMGYDLSQRLNERLQRLAFLEKVPEATPSDDGSSHIHISGHYLIRSRGDDSWELQITPRVRVGGAGAADTLGHQVTFVISRHDVAPAPAEEPRREPPITEDDYAKLIERVYFSAATQIYRQLRTDVARKIGLLPRGFLRATAYLYEADDYAQSNTLAAYDEAAELYRTAVQLFDPSLEPPNTAVPVWRRNPFRRWRGRRMRTAPATRFKHRFRQAKRQMYVARAETGLATVLLYRRMLAGMSGHRVNPIYETRPVVRRAIARLERLPDGTSGKVEALFRAYVAKALAAYQVEAFAEAERALDEARRVSPNDLERNAAYLYAAGLIEPHGRSALPLLRQAVAVEPRFEVAQFELALRDEMAWRRAASLEHAVADIIVAEYEKVLKLNPGNVRAWGNMGYISWLLGNRAEARRFYQRGREYKDLNPGIQVANLDFGLARVEAEEGNVDAAYTWYRSAVTAQVAMGASDSRYTSAQYYAFDFVGQAMLNRFERYKRQVEATLGRRQRSADGHGNDRVFDAVLGYVYNDLGEACHTFSIRNSSRRLQQRAERYYRRAIELNPIAVLPNYNLYLLYTNRGATDDALVPLSRVRELEPAWPDAIVAWLAAHAERATDDAVKSNGAQTPVEEIKAHAESVTRNDEMLRLVRTLLPHQWLWRGSGAGDDEPFDWRALQNPRYRQALRWERELNDLHVRVLLSWGAAELLVNGAGMDRARSAGGRRERPTALLDHIYTCYWPGNFRVLLTERYWNPDGRLANDAEQGLRDVLRRWLAADPTAHWALKVMTTRYYDVNGEQIPVLGADEIEQHLRRARERCGANETDLTEWIDERLAELVPT